MIVKVFEFKKINISKFSLFLFYGKNEGLQNEIINKYFLDKFEGQINKYEESEFINNIETITTELLNRSLFDDKRILIISRVGDKIFKYVEELSEKNLDDIKILLKSGPLEKRSKLRNYCEKNKSLIVIPTYEDNENSLSALAISFLNENRIKISRETLNLLINRAKGERQNLQSELDKILNYSQTNKNISFDVINKLSNLSENYEVNELANNYLAKNKKNVSKILNENNYTNEDCILILRTLLNKSKKLLEIIKKNEQLKNIDQVLSSTKPPIFWKDKENIKIQAKSWKLKDLKNKIYEMNNVETLIKSNSKNSLNIISDFIVNY
tara:strand:+ start:1645 stop:2622 length:978 start_codon:yes stop_codon:yes gene_type:complete